MATTRCFVAEVETAGCCHRVGAALESGQQPVGNHGAVNHGGAPAAKDPARLGGAPQRAASRTSLSRAMPKIVHPLHRQVEESAAAAVAQLLPRDSHELSPRIQPLDACARSVRSRVHRHRTAKPRRLAAWNSNLIKAPPSRHFQRAAAQRTTEYPYLCHHLERSPTAHLHHPAAAAATAPWTASTAPYVDVVGAPWVFVFFAAPPPPPPGGGGTERRGGAPCFWSKRVFPSPNCAKGWDPSPLTRAHLPEFSTSAVVRASASGQEDQLTMSVLPAHPAATLVAMVFQGRKRRTSRSLPAPPRWKRWLNGS